jgi:restriction endonuclease S subunit
MAEEQAERTGHTPDNTWTKSIKNLNQSQIMIARIIVQKLDEIIRQVGILETLDIIIWSRN